GAPVKLAELDQDGPAIAYVHRRVGLEDQQPVDNGQGLGPVFAPRVDALKIPEHPDDDLGLRCRREVRVGELHLSADCAGGDGLGFLTREAPAPTERIQQHELVVDARADTEMSREPDAEDLEADAAADLHDDYR